MRYIKKGATSQSIYFDVLDATSTSGGRKTGLAYNTASLTAYYVRNQASATAITLATLAAANSAWSSGGFKEVDATNMPGVYRLDVPDAAFAAGADSVAIVIKGATGMVQVGIVVQLTGVDHQDAVRAGMTALPNANAEAAGGLYTRGTGAGQINQDGNGRIDVNLKAILGTVLTETAGQIAAAFKKLFDVASPVLTAASVNQTGDNYARTGAPAGASIAADIAAAKVDTAAIKTQTDKLAFTVANQVDANVKSNAGAAITAASGVQEVKVASIATDAVNAAAVATDAVNEIRAAVTGGAYSLDTDANGRMRIVDGTGAGEIDTTSGKVSIVAGDIASIQSGLSTLDAAGVRAALGMASADLDTQLDAIVADTGEIGTAGAGLTALGDSRLDALDAAVSTRLAAGSYTAPPSASTIAAAVWDALTSALSTASSIGKLLVDNINASISSRLASASYTAPDNSGITAIKAKTDNLPSDPADQSLIIAATDAIMTRIGSPAGADIAADIAANGTAIAALNDLSSTDLASALDARIGSPLKKTTDAIGRATVTSGASTTSLPTSACTPAGAVADQLKGRIVLFDVDTTTAELRGVARAITAASNDAAPTFTLDTALPATPASGDTFSIV